MRTPSAEVIAKYNAASRSLEIALTVLADVELQTLADVFLLQIYVDGVTEHLKAVNALLEDMGLQLTSIYDVEDDEDAA